MNTSHVKFIKKNFKKIVTQSVFWFIYSLKKPYMEKVDERATISQKKFYKHSLVDGFSASSRITTYNLFQGEIDSRLFEEAVNHVCNQHDIFRTTFFMKNSQLYFTVHDKQFFTVEQYDLSSSHNSQNIEKLCNQLALEPFNPEQLPLFKISIILLPNHYFKIVACFHHMIADGWTLYHLQTKIAKTYASLIDKKPLAACDKNIQFGDYIFIENMTNSWFEKSRLSFWKKYLQRATPLALPFLNMDTAPTQKADNTNIMISKNAFKAIKDLKKKMGVSNNTILLGVFITLLYRYSRQETITVIIPRFARFHPKQQSIMGPMLDGLPLILDMNDNLSFFDVITQLKNVMNEIMSHDDIPFDYILEKLQYEHQMNLNFFQNAVVFNYISAEWRKHFNLKNAEFIKEAFISTTISNLMNFYIIGEFVNGQSLLSGQLTFQTECIDNLTARFFLEQYQDLIEKIAENPDMAINQYQLLTYYRDITLPNVKQNLIQEQIPLITALLLKSFEKNNNHTAISCFNQQYTYQDLFNTVLLVFSALRDMPKPPAYIITGKRNLLWHAALVSALFLNVPFCLIDESAEEQVLNDRLPHLNNALVLKSSPLHERTRDIINDNNLTLIDLDKISIEKVPATIHELRNYSSKIRPHDLSYIMFTSGSTNKPKVIYGNHLGLSQFINWQVNEFHLNNTDICGQITNVHFDVCLREIFSPLVSGAKLVVPDNSLAENALIFFDWIDKEDITFFHVVPSLFHMIMLNSTHFGAHNLRSLRYIFFAGEALTLNLIRTLQRNFYNYGVLINLYGPSETTLAKVCYMVPEHPQHQIMPIGKPIPGCQVFIMNNKKICGICESGEIVIRTPYMTNLAPEDDRLLLNAESDQPDDRLYRTGDLGLIKPNGEIYILGRTDSVSKINGIRVDLSKIQQQLMELSYIKECCVTINTNQSQDTQFLVAHVVIAQDNQLELTELIINNQLKKNGGSGPAPHVYNVMDKLPRLSSHKFNKIKLSSLKIEELNRLNQAASQKLIEAKNSTELKIQSILSGITQNQEISCDKMFDQLGITSLQIVQFLMKLQHDFEQPISLQDIFKHNTIQKLSRFLDKNQNEEIKYSPLTGLTANYLRQYAELPKLKHDGAFLKLITSVKQKPAAKPAIRKIFLTGASGFLGKYLLVELLAQFPEATVYCLVRGKDNEHALARLKEQLLLLPMDVSLYEHRLKSIVGDLDKERFSLQSDEFKSLQNDIDLIVHCGAYVNFISDFHTLFPSNVNGTKTIIELAASRKIPVHYVSTAGIFPGRKEWEHKKIEEDTDIYFEDGFPLIGGYSQTKWVAESLMQKARTLGVPVSIYRFGRISGDTVTGNWPVHDFVMAYLISMVQLGIAPNLSTKIEMIPVDTGARLMIGSCSMNTHGNQTYHIINPNQISFSDLKVLFAQIGFSLKLVTYEVWKAQLTQAVLDGKDNALTRFLPLFPEKLDDLPRLKFNRQFSNRTLEPIINRVGIEFPKLTSELLKFYLEKNTNFLTH